MLTSFIVNSRYTVDVTEGSRLYENIFVSGGALLADDTILKTIEIGKEFFYCVKGVNYLVYTPKNESFVHCAYLEIFVRNPVMNSY